MATASFPLLRPHLDLTVVDSSFDHRHPFQAHRSLVCSTFSVVSFWSRTIFLTQGTSFVLYLCFLYSLFSIHPSKWYFKHVNLIKSLSCLNLLNWDWKAMGWNWLALPRMITLTLSVRPFLWHRCLPCYIPTPCFSEEDHIPEYAKRVPDSGPKFALALPLL